MKTLVIFFLFLCTLSVNAQYNNYCHAEIYMKNNDVIKCQARLQMIRADTGIISNSKTKEVLRYIIGKQRTSTKVSPKDIDKIIFEIKEKIKGQRVSRKVTYISFLKNKKKSVYGFAELIEDGEVKMIQRTVMVNSQTIIRNIKENLLVRNDNNEAHLFNLFKIKSLKNKL